MIEYFEPVMELDLPRPEIDLDGLSWIRYNPRKNISRWGVSLTSLDGATTGIPDLDSLYEYNKINATNFRETDFTVPTPTYQKYFSHLGDHFDLGRSHLIKLGSGGFFPYHRDLDLKTFRLVYTIRGCDPSNLVWILNEQVIKMGDRKWYYINTKFIHSVFSFFGSEFAVFNVLNNDKAREAITRNLFVR